MLTVLDLLDSPHPKAALGTEGRAFLRQAVFLRKHGGEDCDLFKMAIRLLEDYVRRSGLTLEELLGRQETTAG